MKMLFLASLFYKSRKLRPKKDYEMKSIFLLKFKANLPNSNVKTAEDDDSMSKMKHLNSKSSDN